MFYIWFQPIDKGLLWSWSYGSWIYNYRYLYNQCPSPLTLWVGIRLTGGVFDTTLCDKLKTCQCHAAGQWFSLDIQIFSTNKTDRHDITEILLKVVLNTITLTPTCNQLMTYLFWPPMKTINLAKCLWPINIKSVRSES